MIRIAESADAAGLAVLMEEADASGFMLYNPGERSIPPEKLAKRIEAFRESPESEWFVAEEDGMVAGYMMLRGSQLQRTRHSLYLVIGVAEAFRRRGIGRQLFEAMEDWAQKKQIRRIELTVIRNNVPALSLYQKMGFEIEGTKRDSLLIDGEYRDELYLSKLIGPGNFQKSIAIPPEV